MRGNGQRLALVAAGIAGVLALAGGVIAAVHGHAAAGGTTGGTTTGDTSGSVWG